MLPPDVVQLLDRLREGDAFERYAALDALNDTCDPEASAAVVAFLMADSDPGVREHAARVAMLIHGEYAARAITPLIASPEIKVRNLAGEVLVGLGRPAVPALLPCLTDPDKDVRKFAIDVLALLPASDTCDEIAACLRDPDENVVLAAVDALAALGVENHVEELRDLYHRLPVARPGIVAALGSLPDPEIPAFLEQAVTDEDPVVCLAAAEALARFEGSEVLALLLRQAEAVHPMARPIVLESIVRLCAEAPDRSSIMPERIRPLLVEMLGDPDTGYQIAAVRGLSYYGDTYSAAQMLKYAGKNDKVDVEIFSVVAQQPEPLRLLIEAASEGTMKLETAAGFTLALLARMAIPEDQWSTAARFLALHFAELEADTRLAAIDITGRIGNPALFPILKAGLMDADPSVSSFASDAVEQSGLDLMQLQEETSF